MTTPQVTELPLELQPTHHDPFIDRLAMPGAVRDWENCNPASHAPLTAAQLVAYGEQR